MRSLTLTLFIFGMVVLLSSAFPVDNPDTNRTSLPTPGLRSYDENDAPGAKRKPVKMPGPKYNTEDEDPDAAYGEEQKSKSEKPKKTAGLASGIQDEAGATRGGKGRYKQLAQGGKRKNRHLS